MAAASPYTTPSSASSVEALLIQILGDATSYLDAIARSTKATRDATAVIARGTNEIQGYMSSMGNYARFATSMLGELGVSIGVIGVLSKSLSFAAQAESMQLQFGVMLRNAEAGKTMFRDLARFAADTPLELPGITSAARTLLQYGVAGRDVIPTLRRIGDVAGGQDAEMQRLALAYGQVIQSGRLMGQEARQMINAGFNPLFEMARTTGRSMSSLRQDMEDGKISVEMVAAAFQSATAEGGQFHGMMALQAQTLGGLWSTFKDEVIAALREIGQDVATSLDLKGWLRSGVEGAKSFVSFIKSIPPEVKSMVLTFGLVAAGVGAMTIAWRMMAMVLGPTFGLFRMIGSSASGLITTFMQLRSIGLTFGGAIGASLMGLGDGFTSLVTSTTALKVGLAGLVFGGFYLIGTAIAQAIYPIQEFNRELERSRQLSSALESQTGRRDQQRLQEIQGISDPQQRQREMAEELRRAEEEMRSVNARVGGQRRVVERAAPSWMSGWQSGRAIWQMEQENLRALEQRAGGASRNVENLRDALRALEPTTVARQLAEDINALNRDLKEQADLFGLTAEQKKIYDLAMRGATDDQLAEARRQERRVRAGAISRENEDPVSRFARMGAELQELNNMGEISPDVFARAMGKLEDDLIKVGNEARKTANEIRGFDAALVGSAEAARRVESYKEMFSQNVRTDARGRTRVVSPEAEEMLDRGRSEMRNVTENAVNTPVGINWQNPLAAAPLPRGWHAPMELPPEMPRGIVAPPVPMNAEAPPSGPSQPPTSQTIVVAPNVSSGPVQPPAGATGGTSGDVVVGDNGISSDPDKPPVVPASGPPIAIDPSVQADINTIFNALPGVRTRPAVPDASPVVPGAPDPAGAVVDGSSQGAAALLATSQQLSGVVDAIGQLITTMRATPTVVLQEANF